MPPSKEISITIVGAGVFGLSTAVHLLENGYKNVTVYDQQNYEESEYSPFRGADSASADTMKVIRSAYGSESLHHNLATEAISKWEVWNAEAGQPLFVRSGWARITGKGSIPPVELATLATMAASGQDKAQYIIGDPTEEKRALKDGWAKTKYDPFSHRDRGLPLDGVFDTLAGYVYADTACVFALRKAKTLGAKSVLHRTAGRVVEILYAAGGGSNERREGTAKRAIGIRTGDGQEHHSDLVIIAAGARTHGIVPHLKETVTATAANVVHVKVPAQLQDRFKPDVFPVFSWNYTGYDEDGGLSGFPLDSQGTLKFLFRSNKWTNPIPSAPAASEASKIISWPVPWNSSKRTNVPKIVVDTVKDFISAHLPELNNCDILIAKLCWDSFAMDLDFVIDWVPDVENLIVVAGGSGHGFKFLPTLGKHVIDVLEDRSTSFTELWKWRKPSEDAKRTFRDFVVEPRRRLDEQPMASTTDLSW